MTQASEGGLGSSGSRMGPSNIRTGTSSISVAQLGLPITWSVPSLQPIPRQWAWTEHCPVAKGRGQRGKERLDLG